MNSSAIIPHHAFDFARQAGGNKAASLAFLHANGFQAPHFFIIAGQVIERVHNGSVELKPLLNAWAAENSIGENELWAVRSSTAMEDGAEKSFAGLFTTLVNVSLHGLEDAIQTVAKSFPQEQQSGKHAIVLQKMISPEYSGVIFSRNPSDITDETIYFSVVPGLGESLVSGRGSGWNFTWHKGNYRFDDETEICSGDIFREGQTIKIQKEAAEIKKDLDSHLDELAGSVKKIAALKKEAVDIEFCIAGGKIYWLQVRPITTGKSETQIWDNTFCESNYPGLTLPLSISLVRESMYTGYGHMARFLSFPESWTESNKAFLKNMCGGINGALYYNVSAWQKLIDQIPFGKKAAQRLPELWGMDPAPFRPEQIKLKRAQKMRIYFRLTLSFLRFKKIRRDYLKIYNEVQEKITRTDLRVLMSGDLKKLYDEIHMRLGNNWSAPLINGFFTLVFLGAFKKLLKNSDLRDRYPNFFNDVLFSNDVISLKIIREFQAISETVRNDKPLLSLFETSDAAKILATLESDYPALHKRIREYIFLYGERCEDSELKLETITYQEEPAFFIKALQSTVHSGPAHTARRFDYKKALKEAYPLNFGKRWLFSWIIAQARERVKERENFRFMRTKAFGMLRKIFRTLDGELFQEKWIEKNGDSLYLELEEIFDSSRKAEYKEIIKKRKDAYARYAEQKSFPARFLAVEGKFSPVQAAVASGGEIIKGTGCCSGIVKSQVRILHEQETIGDVSGKIIVAAYIEPGKLSLFARAAGIVSVRGNLLSHTAILCREMGLPSIVGAKGAMNKLKDGDLVEMDGATGKIILLGHD